MNRIPSIVALGILVSVAGCDRKPAAPPPKPVAINTSTSLNPNDALAQQLKTHPKQGGILTVHPTAVIGDVDPNGTLSQLVRLSNEGDDDVSIISVISPSAQEGLGLSGSCTRPNVVVPPGQSCEINVDYQDHSGKTFNGTVLITTNAERSRSLRFDVNVTLRAAVAAQAQPTAPAQVLRQRPVQDMRYERSLAAAQAQRLANQRNFGPSATAPGSDIGIPVVTTRDSDPRYDPDRVPWTESSLMVNRHNILTADRMIPAVIESPVSAIMCNQVTAVVDNNVYSPDSDNILIPAGTRAIGHCGKFTDERLNITWFRMITPQGVNITFNHLQADTADAMGRGGAVGTVQQRAFDRYAAPILESGVDMLSVAARAAFGSNQTTSYNSLSGQQSNSESKYDAAIDDFNNRAAGDIKNGIQSLLDQRRNVVVAPGTRIEILPQEDIYFKTPSQVIRLADYEYEIRQQTRRPTAIEQPAPTLNLAPQLNGSGAETIQVEGRSYVVQPSAQAASPREAAAGVGNTQADPNAPSMRAGANNAGTNNGTFYQVPRVYQQNPATSTRGAASSNYGGISNLNQTLNTQGTGYTYGGTGGTLSNVAGSGSTLGAAGGQNIP